MDSLPLTFMKQKIQTKIKESLKDKDTLSANVYRGVLAVIQEREARENKTFSDDDILKIIEKESQSYLETAKGFKDRRDWVKVDEENYKSEILQKLLPEKIHVDMYPDIVSNVINELDAISIKDMGRVIKHLKTQYGIQLDMGMVSKLVKEKLS